MILLSPMLTARFGKKAIAVVGFALMTIVSGLWYLREPQQIWAMVGLTVLGAIAYGPTIPVLWSMFADVADFSEWKNRPQRDGHRVRHDLLRAQGGPGPGVVPRAAAARLVRIRRRSGADRAKRSTAFA